MSPFFVALVVSQSTIYVWTDKNGDHYTDDRSSIPRGVKFRTTEGDEISRVESAKPPSPTVMKPSSEPAVPSSSEQTWRALFKAARTRVAVLEEDIEADRRRVEEVNGMPVSGRLVCSGWWGHQVAGYQGRGLGVQPCVYTIDPEFERVRERLEKNRRELVRAKEELNDLERRASFEAVPLHWRR